MVSLGTDVSHTAQWLGAWAFHRAEFKFRPIIHQLCDRGKLLNHSEHGNFGTACVSVKSLPQSLECQNSSVGAVRVDEDCSHFPTKVTAPITTPWLSLSHPRACGLSLWLSSPAHALISAPGQCEGIWTSPSAPANAPGQRKSLPSIPIPASPAPVS